MAEAELEHRVAAVRRFNRFYTKQIGVLQEHLLKSPFSLTEARIVYELAHRGQTTATELCQELGLDAGYVSRLVRAFQRRGLVRRRRSDTDGRQTLLSLTDRGQDAFADLNGASHHEIEAMLAGLAPEGQTRLLEALHAIEDVLGARPDRTSAYLLRSPQAGDLGWVVHRHGVLYAAEYGWNEEFEALVAEIVARFVQDHDPKRERCWIAEQDGANVGSVFLVKKSPSVAQLRLMLVEPRARGLGIGTRLVSECVQFAQRVGYRKMTLWTNSVLAAARHIYAKAGFRIVRTERHRSFGHRLVGETWELTLPV